jgi:hypothetical protein
MRLRAALLVTVTLASLFAGCSANARSASTPSAEVVSAAAAPPSKGALLRVLVITDEYLPVADAQVTIVGLGVNGTTDGLGDVFFHLAQPGRYALHVHHAGFYPNRTKVQIEEGSAVVRVHLRDAPHAADFADFYYYTGLCGTTLFVQGVSQNGNCSETPDFPKPHARWLLGPGLVHGFLELNWPHDEAGTGTMRLEIRFPEIGPFKDGRTVLVAEGPSPVKVTIPDELLTDAHRKNGAAVDLQVGLAQNEAVNRNGQQTFHIEAQFDYVVPAPDVDPET